MKTHLPTRYAGIVNVSVQNGVCSLNKAVVNGVEKVERCRTRFVMDCEWGGSMDREQNFLAIAIVVASGSKEACKARS